MSSVCISSCVKDARIPVRANYINLYKWPESDAEFVRSVSNNKVQISSSTGNCTGGMMMMMMNSPRVVDSMSCRQIYLRSYTFSKKETVPEKTRKCLGRVKERVLVNPNISRKKKKKKKKKTTTTKNGGGGGGGVGVGRKCMVMRKVKEMSCAAFCSIFNKLLSCTSSMEVVDRS